MPSVLSTDFEKFIVQLGLGHDVAVALWDADIRTPQEVGSVDIAELKKVSNNRVLVNMIYPILQKHVFNITMAKDPYKKAMAIIRKQVPVDDDDEPMDTGFSADSTVSDALGYVDGRTGQDIGSSRPPVANVTQQARDGRSYTNRGSRMNVSGGGIFQSNINVGGSRKPADKDCGHSITITGGNFVQANVLGKGPVTYNNTGTVISTALEQNVPENVGRRRAQLLNETFFLDGQRLRIADLRWNDGADYWVDDVRMQNADREIYVRGMQSDDVYQVRSHGNSRALILNNSHFNAPGMSTRTGAEVDCNNMESALRKMGFRVSVAKDKTAAEMRSLLQDFAQSTENIKADMIAVYIGSHGERDAQGNDAFVGTDGETVNFKDVKEMFGPQQSPRLAKKPKLFFLQFCRQSNVNSDAGGFSDEQKMAEEPVPEVVPLSQERRTMDMLCVYATLAGSKAYRDTTDGSWFVTALIRVFQEHAHKDDLLSMLTKVNSYVSVNKGMESSTVAVQISEVVHNLRKKVFFYPGLNA